MNWLKVTKPKDEGGLGISNLHETNLALLSKWLWRYHMEPKALWRRLIQAKYRDIHIGDIPTNDNFSSSKAPSRSITKNLRRFKDNQSWKINNGDQISFWHSNWSQEGSLSINYTLDCLLLPLIKTSQSKKLESHLIDRGL